MTCGFACTLGGCQTAVGTCNGDRTAVDTCCELLNRLAPRMRSEVYYISPAVSFFGSLAVSARPYIVTELIALCLLVLRDIVIGRNFRNFTFFDKIMVRRAAVFAIGGYIAPIVLTVERFASRYAAGGGSFDDPLLLTAVIRTAVPRCGNHP